MGHLKKMNIDIKEIIESHLDTAKSLLNDFFGSYISLNPFSRLVTIANSAFEFFFLIISLS